MKRLPVLVGHTVRSRGACQNSAKFTKATAFWGSVALSQFRPKGYEGLVTGRGALSPCGCRCQVAKLQLKIRVRPLVGKKTPQGRKHFGAPKSNVFPEIFDLLESPIALVPWQEEFSDDVDILARLQFKTVLRGELKPTHNGHIDLIEEAPDRR